MCVCGGVCGRVCYHDKTKTPDRNDLKLSTVVVLDTLSKLIELGSIGRGSRAHGLLAINQSVDLGYLYWTTRPYQHTQKQYYIVAKRVSILPHHACHKKPFRFILQLNYNFQLNGK